MTTLLFAFLFLFQPSAGDTTAVNSQVASATVFLRGAQVHRTATVNLNRGTNYIRFEGLSPSLNEETMQLRTNGDIILESIAKSVDYNSKSSDQQLDNLQSQKQTLEKQAEKTKAQLTVLDRKLNVLTNNQDISGENAKVSAVELRQAVDYFGEEFEAIEMKRLELNDELKKLNEQLANINREIAIINNKNRRAAGRVEMAIRSDARQQLTLDLSYFVSAAGWSPSYDARVENIGEPLEFEYKANISQNTGIDWENVNLTISSARPRRSSTLPTINPVYLEFYQPRKPRTSEIQMDAEPQQFKMQNLRSSGEAGISQVSGVVLDAQTGQPISSANIVVQGTNQGTSSNQDGTYSLSLGSGAKALRVTYIGYKPEIIPISSPRINIRLKQADISLSETVVTALGSPVQNQLQQGQTSFSYKIKNPYTIKSGESEKTVAVESYSLPATYHYLSIPKEQPEAFLTANIADWESLNLLPGTVSLFMDNAYVGKTRLDKETVADTLSLSLGKDDGITIERKQNESFREKNFFGNRVTETKGWDITVRNTKSTGVDIEIRDQVPVSSNEDIGVEIEERSGADYNKSTGILKWNLNLEPSESRTLQLVYKVTYPSGKQIEERQ